MHIDAFRELVLDYYKANKRLLPWREKITPYGVVVSEIMLQQTQVPRVLVKYPEFMARFPSFEALAKATVPEVLQEWQGMGYNRRGKYLRDIAVQLVEKYKGVVPKSIELVDELPGIGPATAASIITYTYNIPSVFIETNIRRVFIHHFFADMEDVPDTKLYPLVEEALDRKNPREWYYALMDYGTYLAKTVENPNRKSKHYAVQSKFEGSVRQIRGAVLRTLLAKKAVTFQQLEEELDPARLESALQGLVSDKMVVKHGDLYSLSEK